MEVLVFEHFNAIFGQAAVRRSSINFEVLGILPVDLHQLDLAITPEEVWAAIRDMPSDKALGLDGFTGAFFKSAWQIINDDFMEAINAFIEGSGQRLHLINNALVVHLPEEGHLTPGYYRPITLVHSFGKIVSKILSLRLTPRLEQLIAKNQNAFTRRRFIHDNFKYVQRVEVLFKRKKISKILLKLDISKAFDTLSWAFLLELLVVLGFGPRWRRWISQLLASSSSRVLLNGRPGRPIRHFRGVRQGDSLSPMLFILAMDVLNRIFIAAASTSILQPLEVSAVKYQCSLYVDDVFCSPVLNNRKPELSSGYSTSLR
jgi:uncharacterized protein YggT (Ycf19 family)